MTPLRVYLADLTHVGNGIATEGFPLNIGLLSSHAKQRFGQEVDIELFKYPQDLREALIDRPPHLLGCSNYVWNSNLSYYFCSMAKSIDPKMITVFGGTNYPFDNRSQEKFLRKRPDVNFHVYYEGEISFSNILERALSVSDPYRVFDEPIAGSQFISPDSGQFLSGPPVPRIKNLDSVPSPYVSGLLDKFFDGHLTPLVETARGCPFTCNFCNAYHEYFTKVNKFSDDYVREELTYIAKRASATGVSHVTILDNNFGMIPRDWSTAQLFASLKTDYGWPMSISAWTGKNAKERVIDVTKVLGETLSISMSVQSMDATVLKNIGRQNIRGEDYREISDNLSAQGRPQHAEIIMPLPGETFATHIKGLNELLDTNVSKVLSYTLQVLHGTPYKDDENFRREHGYVTKFRIVPLDFSQFDDDRIFDVEEVGVATNAFSFDEYIEARKYLLVTDLCFSSGVFDPLKKYLASRNIRNSDLAQYIYARIDQLPSELAEIFQSFASETEEELWDTEEELVEFYSQPKNYEKLVNYDAGGNVLFKHRIWTLTKQSQKWADEVFNHALSLAIEGADETERSAIQRELSSLKSYVLLTVSGALSPDGIQSPIDHGFEYDIPAWLKVDRKAMLGEYAMAATVPLRFHLSSDAVAVLNDGFERYGTDVAGLTKLIQRVAGVSLMRDVSYSSNGTGDVADGRRREPLYGPGYSPL